MIVNSSIYSYTDPTFIGVDWFIRCDEDEGCRLIIKSRARTLKAALAKARKCIKGASLSASVGVNRVGYQTRTAFAPLYSGLHAAWNFSIAISGLMPDTAVYAARILR